MAANRSALVATGVAALVAGGLLAWHFKPAPAAGPPALSTVENMGHLVSVRARTADVIDFALPRAVDIPMTDYEIRYGGTSILLIARGECSLATDLRQAKYESVDADARRLTLVLPLPVVLSARVDHSPADQGGSVLYRIDNNALEAFIPDDSNRTQAVDQAFARAEAGVAAACRRNDLVRQAKQNTESLLAGMYEAAGWHATFRWR